MSNESASEGGNVWFEGDSPCFFVSVASKGFSQAVSLLFATPAGRSVSVAANGLIEEDARR
jgi:hypothetical protein